MRAIRNKVILTPMPSEDISQGGIIVPNSFKAVSNKMKVVSAGRGTKTRPMHDYLKEGTIVYRVKNHGTEIEEKGEKMFIMDMDAILAYEN